MSSSARATNTSAAAAPGGDTDDLRALRRAFGRHLPRLRDMFPQWSEHDLLYVLKDTDGDILTAVERISDGVAVQWGEVKTRKARRAENSQQGASGGGGGGGEHLPHQRGQSSSGYNHQTAASSVRPQSTRTPAGSGVFPHQQRGGAAAGYQRHQSMSSTTASRTNHAPVSSGHVVSGAAAAAAGGGSSEWMSAPSANGAAGDVASLPPNPSSAPNANASPSAAAASRPTAKISWAQIVKPPAPVEAPTPASPRQRVSPRTAPATTGKPDMPPVEPASVPKEPGVAAIPSPPAEHSPLTTIIESTRSETVVESAVQENTESITTITATSTNVVRESVVVAEKASPVERQPPVAAPAKPAETPAMAHSAKASEIASASVPTAQSRAPGPAAGVVLPSGNPLERLSMQFGSLGMSSFGADPAVSSAVPPYGQVPQQGIPNDPYYAAHPSAHLHHQQQQHHPSAHPHAHPAMQHYHNQHQAHYGAGLAGGYGASSAAGYGMPDYSAGASGFYSADRGFYDPSMSGVAYGQQQSPAKTVGAQNTQHIPTPASNVNATVSTTGQQQPQTSQQPTGYGISPATHSNYYQSYYYPQFPGASSGYPTGTGHYGAAQSYGAKPGVVSPTMSTGTAYNSAYSSNAKGYGSSIPQGMHQYASGPYDDLNNLGSTGMGAGGFGGMTAASQSAAMQDYRYGAQMSGYSTAAREQQQYASHHQQQQQHSIGSGSTAYVQVVGGQTGPGAGQAGQTGGTQQGQAGTGGQQGVASVQAGTGGQTQQGAGQTQPGAGQSYGASGYHQGGYGGGMAGANSGSYGAGRTTQSSYWQG